MVDTHMIRVWLTAGGLLCALTPGAYGQGSPTFVVSDIAVAEGDGGVSTATFTVSLVNPNNVESRVHFVTADGSAQGAAATYSSSGVAIPVMGPATPYPAVVNVGLPAGTIQHVAVRLNQLSHTFPADLDILLVGPGGQKVMVMSDVGIAGDVVNISPTFQDGAPAPPTQLVSGTFAPTDNSPGAAGEMPAPAPPGPYGTRLSVFNGTNPNGVWSLYVSDDQFSDSGSMAGFSLILTMTSGGDYVPTAGLLTFPPGRPTRSAQVAIKGDTMPEPDETFTVNLLAPFNAVLGDAQGIGTILNDDGVTNAQPPTGLRVTSIVGNLVTFRWNAPLVGPGPTTYVIEGGTTPGGVLAGVPTGSTAPIATLPLPAGSFYIRVHTVAGASKSVASNEVLVLVNPQVPTPPSAPVTLLGTVATSRLGLTWHNTFNGGAPTGIVLDVTGPVSASVPLPLTNSFAYPTMPAGTYTFRVRAANAAGVSAPSNPVILTFPGACLGVLQPPSNFLAYRIGNVLHLLWEPPTIGPAPTGYRLEVSGSAVGAVPTTAQTLTGAVGAGTYVLSVRALNHCGPGLATPAQTVVVP